MHPLLCWCWLGSKWDVQHHTHGFQAGTTCRLSLSASPQAGRAWVHLFSSAWPGWHSCSVHWHSAELNLNWFHQQIKISFFFQCTLLSSFIIIFSINLHYFHYFQEGSPGPSPPPAGASGWWSEGWPRKVHPASSQCSVWFTIKIRTNQLSRTMQIQKTGENNKWIMKTNEN